MTSFLLIIKFFENPILAKKLLNKLELEQNLLTDEISFSRKTKFDNNKKDSDLYKIYNQLKSLEQKNTFRLNMDKFFYYLNKISIILVIYLLGFLTFKFDFVPKSWLNSSINLFIEELSENPKFFTKWSSKFK